MGVIESFSILVEVEHHLQEPVLAIRIVCHLQCNVEIALVDGGSQFLSIDSEIIIGDSLPGFLLRLEIGHFVIQDMFCVVERVLVQTLLHIMDDVFGHSCIRLQRAVVMAENELLNCFRVLADRTKEIQAAPFQVSCGLDGNALSPINRTLPISFSSIPISQFVW